MNKLTRASQDHDSVANFFLDLPWHLNRPSRTSRHLLGGQKGVIRSFPHINRLAQASQDFHSSENCFLCLPWHLNSPTRASQHQVKRFSHVFPAHKRSCTNLTGLPRWWKLLSRSSLALKQASTCFTAHPRWLKRLCQVISSHKKACTSLIGPPQRW